jgi:hypothetical protein
MTEEFGWPIRDLAFDSSRVRPAPTSGVHWKVGKPIDALTKAGSPLGQPCGARYWKNSASEALDGEYSSGNMARMRRGQAPLHDEVGVPKELNHIVPRYQSGRHSFDNLEEVWPCQHAAINPFRYYTGPEPR